MNWRFELRWVPGGGAFFGSLLTESVLLSLAGGALGILFSVWGVDLLKAVGARTLPRLAEVSLDLTVLATMAALSIGTGILFGLVPALVSAKPELTEALKDGGRGATAGRSRNRLRDILVVCEIALALVLLTGAGLLMKSFVRLQGTNPGFNSHNVLTMEVALPVTKYPEPASDKKSGDSRVAFFDETQRRVAHLPGVEAVAWTNILPLSGTNSDSSFAIEGRTTNSGTPFPDEEIRTVTPDYFRVLQATLVRGRFFTEADNADAPRVTIINTPWPGNIGLTKMRSANESPSAIPENPERSGSRSSVSSIVFTIARSIRIRCLNIICRLRKTPTTKCC